MALFDPDWLSNSTLLEGTLPKVDLLTCFNLGEVPDKIRIIVSTLYEPGY